MRVFAGVRALSFSIGVEMATYDSPRSEVISNLQESVGGYLAQQILSALNEGGQGQADEIKVQSAWVPGTQVDPGTNILIATPGSVDGNIEVPASVSALLFTGSTGVQATFNVVHDVAIELSNGDDVIRVTAPDSLVPETITVDLGQGNDVYVGAVNAHNNVILGEGNNEVTGGDLSDSFDIGQGSGFVDAGEGYDLAYVRGSISDYTSSYENGVLTLTNILTNAVTQVKDLEFLTFENGGVIINVDTEAGFASAALYETVLGRSADSEGHAFYSQMAGTELIQVPEDLINSDEFASDHGSVYAVDMTDAQFLDIMYENSFGREADAGGQAYWLEKLADGMSKGEVAVRFAYSSEEIAKFDGLINFDQDQTS